jgi:hypothetical protein
MIEEKVQGKQMDEVLRDIDDLFEEGLKEEKV